MSILSQASRVVTGIQNRARRVLTAGAGDGSQTPQSPAIESVPENITQLNNYADLCRQAGVNELFLFLTFDCDTDEDIEAAHQVNEGLQARGIKAGYAVPGAQLLKGPSEWKQLAQTGVEFLNHGFAPHAEKRDGRYWSTTFYHEWQPEEVVADITKGHHTVCDVTGQSPRGFRAPHFGSFQEPEQLDLIYKTVKPLGYTYASTTIPALALSRGPVVDMGGITELPTMGSYRYPPTILDSWTYLTDRTNYALGEQYHELFAETVDQMVERNLPGILTYYADPSHVAGQAPFKKAMDKIAALNIPTLHGQEAVQKFRPI